MTYIECNSIGSETGEVSTRQLDDGTWEATMPITALFGMEVEGQHRGTGATKEDALSSLMELKRRHDEAMWI